MQRLELEAEVGGRDRVRERANRHEVGAGRRDLGSPLERDAAGDLDRLGRGCARRPRADPSREKLSTRMRVAPAASAWSSSSSVSTSTSIGTVARP